MSAKQRSYWNWIPRGWILGQYCLKEWVGRVNKWMLGEYADDDASLQWKCGPLSSSVCCKKSTIIFSQRRSCVESRLFFFILFYAIVSFVMIFLPFVSPRDLTKRCQRDSRTTPADAAARCGGGVPGSEWDGLTSCATLPQNLTTCKANQISTSEMRHFILFSL